MKKIHIGYAKVYLANKLGESYILNNTINESDAKVSEFIDTIKNSPILQLEFKVFDNIEKKYLTNESAATRYIDNNVKLFEVYTLSEINAEHDKLIPMLGETTILNSPKLKVYDAIDNLIVESVKNHSDVDVDIIDESFTIVLNHIMNNKPTVEKKLEFVNEAVLEIAINKFNERYDELNESDRSLFSEILKSNIDEKKLMFETLKSDNLSLLGGIVEDKYSDKIEKTISKLNEMKYNENTIDEDIVTLHELKAVML